ncbi:MAG: sugar transferase [Salinivirgaceae bacterium]|nr:sugar transferase [Salinivirgaceae bacterium]MBR3568006.1 sugar transferase [Salinivirgaceae bacterium]
MVKWFFDRTLSLVLLMALMPVLLLVAIVILLTSGAPVFYIQERIGQNAKPFKLIKFRTMKGEEESPVAAAELNRITRVGRWLRRTKIDELPELLNIFVGDMSFVGPRPDVAGYADKLEGDDRRLLTMKPGLTGVASLKYRNEEDLLAAQPNPQEYNDKVIWPDKVRLNLLYMERQSLWLDVKVLICTALGKTVKGFE